MRKILLVFSVSVLASVTSLAATITVSGVFPPTQSVTTPQDPAPQFVVPVPIQKFDPAFGTLLAIAITFGDGLVGSGTIMNNAPDTDTFMIFLAHGLVFSDPFGNMLTQIFPTFVSDPLTIAGNGGSGSVSGSAQDSNSSTFSDFATLNEFTGTGLIATTVSGTNLTAFTGGTNATFSSVTTTSGIVNVVYTYSPGVPVNTPEPAAMTVVGSSLVGLAVRKFVRQNS